MGGSSLLGVGTSHFAAKGKQQEDGPTWPATSARFGPFQGPEIRNPEILKRRRRPRGSLCIEVTDGPSVDKGLLGDGTHLLRRQLHCHGLRVAVGSAVPFRWSKEGFSQTQGTRKGPACTYPFWGFHKRLAQLPSNCWFGLVVLEVKRGEFPIYPQQEPGVHT